MNPVYIRMALYFIAPVAGTLAGVTFDQDAGTLLIELDKAAMGLAGAAAFTAGVFGKWGKA